YSARPGTPAAAMHKQVPVQIARERNRILRDLAAEKKKNFRRSFVGKTIEAITLNRFSENSTEALSDNYVKVQIGGWHAANQWVRCSVTDVTNDELLAVLDDENLVGHAQTNRARLEVVPSF